MIKKVLIMFVVAVVLQLFGGAEEVFADTQTKGEIEIVESALPEAHIKVIGKGYPPRYGKSRTGARLLAKRAAMVDAYRVLASTLNGINGCVSGGSGYFTVSGYIQGAEVKEVRYYKDGRTEVVLILPVSLSNRYKSGSITWDAVIEDISTKGYNVYYPDKKVKQISESEWIQMIGK